MNLFRPLVISLPILAFLILPYTASAEEDPLRGPALASINGKDIYVGDVRSYASKNPLMRGYMNYLAGVVRVLNDLINVQLLVLEGQRRGITRHEHETETQYAWRVRNQLMEPCERPDEARAKAFYDTHPAMFTTPPYVRVNRVYLKQTDEVDGMDAVEFFKKQAEALRQHQLKFNEIVAKIRPLAPNDTEIGDMGFLPMNEQDEVIDLLKKAKVNEVVGPIERDGNVYLFQVTDRRNPITLKWEEVRASVPDIAYSHCKQSNFARLRKEMEKHFPVVMYEQNISALKFY